MTRTLLNVFALLLAAALALAPQCIGPEEGTSYAASAGPTPGRNEGPSSPRVDAAPFPVPTSFPGDER